MKFSNQWTIYHAKSWSELLYMRNKKVVMASAMFAVLWLQTCADKTQIPGTITILVVTESMALVPDMGHLAIEMDSTQVSNRSEA